MSTSWIVACPSGAPLMTAEELVAAAQQRFGAALHIEDAKPEWETDVHLHVSSPPSEPVEIAHFADNRMVGIAGTERQNAWLAAWIRGLLPIEAPRVIASDHEWRGHADLPYGITPERVLGEWVDHTTPGWDARDPDLW